MKNYEIFCKYLGYDIAINKRIKSIINRNERTPSLFFYYNKEYNDYFFKDFSSGVHGGVIKFIMLNENITYEEAVQKVKELQHSNITHVNTTPVKREITFSYHIDTHKDYDLEYWKKYNVNKEYLIKHNVYPIENIFVNGRYVHHRAIGYFDKNGHLQQIYMPANTIYNETSNKRFYNVKKGFYYHSNNSNVLIVTKSKKDLIVLDVLFNSSIDIIAPQSETSKIDEDPKFWILFNKYKKRFINFDNDETGIREAKRFQKYGFELLLCNHSKDVSDGIKNKVNKEELFNIKIEEI